MKKIPGEKIDWILHHDIIYKHSKSGGHGGQNVNKRETKAEGYFNIIDSKILDDEQKQRLLEEYHNHISKKGVMRLTCSEQRYYNQNHQLLIKHRKFLLDYLGEKNYFEYAHAHGKHHNHTKRKKKH